MYTIYIHRSIGTRVVIIRNYNIIHTCDVYPIISISDRDLISSLMNAHVVVVVLCDPYSNLLSAGAVAPNTSTL